MPEKKKMSNERRSFLNSAFELLLRVWATSRDLKVCEKTIVFLFSMPFLFNIKFLFLFLFYFFNKNFSLFWPFFLYVLIHLSFLAVSLN